MTITILLAMFTFSLAMSISPGPVNILIMTSAINNGFKNTFAFISGATIGFTLLLVMIGLGFTRVLNSFPSFLFYLEIIGSLFIIYMGYKIASSTSDFKNENKEVKLLKFHEGFLLQWLNPKAWIASISGVSLYSNSNKELSIFIIIYFFTCYLSLTIWGVLGQKAQLLLKNKLYLKIFNIFMGSILIISALVLLSFNF